MSPAGNKTRFSSTTQTCTPCGVIIVASECNHHFLWVPPPPSVSFPWSWGAQVVCRKGVLHTPNIPNRPCLMLILHNPFEQAIPIPPPCPYLLHPSHCSKSPYQSHSIVSHSIALTVESFKKDFRQSLGHVCLTILVPHKLSPTRCLE